MLRALLCSVVALTLFALTGLCAVEPQKDKTTTKDKAVSGKDKNTCEACVTKVDKKKSTITLKMKDKNGKEVEKTFKLTEEVRMLDSTGRVAAMDVFQSGNEVLVVEAEGKLKQIQKKNTKNSKTKDKSSK